MSVHRDGPGGTLTGPQWRKSGTPGRYPGAPSADTFLSLALRNVMGSLTDLEQLGRALAGSPVDAHACQIMNCPRGSQLTSAIQHTVEVLEETKHAFKSKQLAELRQRLELLLQYN